MGIGVKVITCCGNVAQILHLIEYELITGRNKPESGQEAKVGKTPK